MEFTTDEFITEDFADSLYLLFLAAHCENIDSITQESMPKGSANISNKILLNEKAAAIPPPNKINTPSMTLDVIRPKKTLNREIESASSSFSGKTIAIGYINAAKGANNIKNVAKTVNSPKSLGVYNRVMTGEDIRAISCAVAVPPTSSAIFFIKALPLSFEI